MCIVTGAVTPRLIERALSGLLQVLHSPVTLITNWQVPLDQGPGITFLLLRHSCPWSARPCPAHLGSLLPRQLGLSQLSTPWAASSSP